MTMRLTAMVVFILLGARVFSLVFQGVGGGHWIEHMLTALARRRGRLPDLRQHLHLHHRVLPRLLRDRLHHHAAAGARRYRLSASTSSGSACMICANMQTSFMHPPFGFALFYLRGIAPKSIKTSDIYLAVRSPGLCLQLVLVGLLIAFPQMVTYFLDPAVDAGSRQDQDLVPRIRRRRSWTRPAKVRSQRSRRKAISRHRPAAPDLSQPPSFGEPPAQPRRRRSRISRSRRSSTELPACRT